MKRPFKHTLEIVAAWVAVGVALCAGVLGLVGPLLGGLSPGLQGSVGFVSETVAAMLLPGGLLTAVVAVATLLRRLWWPGAALATIALIILVPELWMSLQGSAGRSPGDSRALRVAAVNLATENDEDSLMEGALREIDADVLVLSEFTSSWASRLEEWFAGDYPHRWQAAAPDRPGYYVEGLRLAIWSRIPAVGDHEVLSLSGCSPQIRVPLHWRGRAFALYGIHPWKPYPLGLYHVAWRDRQKILEWVRRERLPTVVAGDFNAPPGSAFIQRLRLLGLANASESVCGRAPVTWPMHPFMFAPIRVAIAHVMHSEELVAVGFRRGMATNSDHAPVLAELAWQDE